MRKILPILALCVCGLAACGVHEHVPDDADCQHVQYCAECGEQLAERGAHDYAGQPDESYDGFSFYACRVCGEIKIVNEDGLPVVPIE